MFSRLIMKGYVYSGYQVFFFEADGTLHDKTIVTAMTEIKAITGAKRKLKIRKWCKQPGERIEVTRL